MLQIDGTMYFTVGEVACLLGKTVRTVQRWVSEPKNKPRYAPSLTAYVLPDGRKYFKQQEIQDAYTRALGAPISDEALINMLRAARQAASPSTSMSAPVGA
jgi:hypothetical protein